MFSTHSMIRVVSWCIAVCSAILTGIFGATFGGDNWFLIGVFFTVFALISALCPILVNAFFANALRSNIVNAVILGPFMVFFVFTDLVTNGGTAALFRQADLVRTDNQNTNAKNARAEVLRIQKRISDIRKDTAWTSTYRAAGAYDKLIESGEKYVSQEAARGGCGVKCEARMRELDSLRAERANAARREALKAEMVTLERELKAAKLQVLETPTKASAALTHANNVAAGLTGQIDPDAKATFWANYGLSLWSGVAVTVASMAAAILLAFSGAGVFGGGAVQPNQQSPWVMDRQLQDERPPEVVGVNNLKSSPPSDSNQTIVVTNKHDHTDDSLATLMEAVQRINARYAT